MAPESRVIPSSLLARTAGVFYLLTILTGMLALYMSGHLVVPDNAASTATNMLSHENLFRAGFVADAVMTACYIVVTALFYRRFQHTSKCISLAAAFLSLIGCAMMAVSLLSYPTYLLVLKSSATAFSTQQLQSLALLGFGFFRRAYDTGPIFSGIYCLLIGILIIKSGFIPRVIGFLMALAGLGWIT